MLWRPCSLSVFLCLLFLDCIYLLLLLLLLLLFMQKICTSFAKKKRNILLGPQFMLRCSTHETRMFKQKTCSNKSFFCLFFHLIDFNAFTTERSLSLFTQIFYFLYFFPKKTVFNRFTEIGPRTAMSQPELIEKSSNFMLL